MSKKKIVVIGGSILVIALLAAGYFIAVPNYQAGVYKETVAAKQNELDDKVGKLAAVLESDSIVKTEAEASVMRNDVQAGNAAIKEVENALELVSDDLTTFKKWPLLGWTSKYKAAEELRAEEEKYIESTNNLVAEMKELMAYLDKTADAQEKTEVYELALENAELKETPEEYAQAIRDATKKFESAVAEIAKVTPPASLKEMHEYSVKTAKEIVSLMNQIVDAVGTGNLASIEEAANKVAKLGEDALKKTNELNKKFIKQSSQRKLADSLTELDHEIDRKLTAF